MRSAQPGAQLDARGRRRSAQAKRGGPRGCWTRTSPTWTRSGSERRIGSAAVTAVGRTRATSIAGPAAGALPNAQCSTCSGVPGCWPVSCGAEGAAKAARQSVSENPSPLAGMKPTGINARNTRVTSRMLVTSSRLRRLNRVERMSGGAGALVRGVYPVRNAAAMPGHPTAAYWNTRPVGLVRPAPGQSRVGPPNDSVARFAEIALRPWLTGVGVPCKCGAELDCCGTAQSGQIHCLPCPRPESGRYSASDVADLPSELKCS
jgi:hypothetical protein